MVTVLAAALFVHVMFGANGMVVYKQKRADYEALRKQIVQVQQENDRYTQQIQGLKSDQKSIEKEAREQLDYAKPGEYVYVAPAPAKHGAASESLREKVSLSVFLWCNFPQQALPSLTIRSLLCGIFPVLQFNRTGIGRSRQGRPDLRRVVDLRCGAAI